MSNNETFTCIIVDDEPKAAELLAYSLGIVNKNITVTDIFTSWTQALEGIRSRECDILFLDISVQGRNSMDLLRSVPDIQSEIIFVTAYSEHALNAFKFPTSGYLLKPIDELELASSLDRAIVRIRQKRQAQQLGKGHVLLNTKIGIPDNKSVNYIDIRNILYLEAFNTYTKVVLKDREIVSAYNMGRFRELLPPDLFYQIHRSYIVNLDHISRYENAGLAVLDNGKELPVAKTARNQLLSLFNRIKTDLNGNK